MKNKKENHPEGIFIPGGLLLGMGVGFFVNNIPGGMFVGLGLGFIAFGVAILMRKK